MSRGTRVWLPLALAVVHALTARSAAAQDALVLGGGGSRGLAHAGVLVGLERLGHEPRIVTGTSMGAIVGALYAAGYEPEAIWDLVESVDWRELFLPRSVLVGPEREARRPMLTYGLAPSALKGLGGLVPDWQINRLLSRLLFDAGARARGDFDRLPRRFRAVAADLETGEPVVLGRGDLARAARASIAVPGLFAPIAWDGRILVDGGIADNLPISAARALGADHVVAVDVIRPGPTIDATEPIGVGIRGLRLLIGNARPEGVEPDVLLAPDIGPGIAEFTFPADPTPLLRAGLAVALAELGPASAETRPRPDKPGERVISTKLPPPPEAFGALVIDSVEAELAALARRAFDGVAPGPYDPAAVLDAMDRLYATGLFDGVWPSVEAAPVSVEAGPAGETRQERNRARPASAPALRLRLVPAPRAAIGGSLGYDNDRGGRVWGAFDLRTKLGVPGELTLAASAHELEWWGAASARVFALPWIPLAIGAGGYFREMDVRRFAAGAIVGETEVRRAGGWFGLELQRPLAEWAAVAAVRAEHVAVENGSSGVSIGPLVRLAEMRSLGEPVGVPAEFEAEVRFGDLAYARARVGGSLEGSAGPLRVAAVGDLAWADADAPPDAVPALGDGHAVPGLRWGEERGRLRVVGGADFAYPIPLWGGYARVRLRAGAAVGELAQLDRTDVWIPGAELGVLWLTPLGPISVGVGGNSRGDWRLNVNAGPWF